MAQVKRGGNVGFACEAIVERPDGVLVWIGHEFDAMAEVVKRLNAKEASETDLIAASTFPVFREARFSDPAMVIHYSNEEISL